MMSVSGKPTLSNDLFITSLTGTPSRGNNSISFSQCLQFIVVGIPCITCILDAIAHCRVHTRTVAMHLKVTVEVLESRRNIPEYF